MKFLAGFLAPLLISALFGAVLTFTLSRTLLNTDYLKKQADKAQLYPELTKLLPEQIAAQVGKDAGNPAEIKKAIAGIITDKELEAKVSTFLDDFQAHYQNGGPAPQLDLSDIAKKARAQGLEVPDEALKPITISADMDKQIQTAFQTSQKAQLAALVTAAILFLLLFLISVKQHNYWALLFVLFASAVLQFIVSYALKLAPDQIMAQVKVQPEMQGLVTVIERFGRSIAADLSQNFLGWMIGFIVAGVIVLVLAIVSKLRYKSQAKLQKVQQA